MGIKRPLLQAMSSARLASRHHVPLSRYDPPLCLETLLETIHATTTIPGDIVTSKPGGPRAEGYDDFDQEYDQMNSVVGRGRAHERTELLPRKATSKESVIKPRHAASLREDSDMSTRRIGVVSAIFIIFNRIIGTGIFATPSMILGLSGSVGLSLLMWLLGALIAAAGMQTYIIWGTALPHNGGEKNYLEYLFPRPRRLITSVYAANAVLLAYAAGNSLVFAEYTLEAVAPDVATPPTRPVALFCLTFAALLHGLHVAAGLRLQNALGMLKIVILLIVVGSGILAASGRLAEGVDTPNNFASWAEIWRGSRSGATVVCACLYNVIWSYVGFSNANYALSEMKNPARTLRIAGPVAIVVVTIFYLAANLAYLFAASKEEITGSGRLVASLLFRNVWGPNTERVLSAFVALSALGNVLSVSFSQGRVNQALGKQGVLPFSEFWASDWPRKGPLAGLALHWFVCAIVVYGLPAGDAYNFVLNVVSYPLAVINATISFGLIALSLRRSSSWGRRFSPLIALLQSFDFGFGFSPSWRTSAIDAPIEIPAPTPSLLLPAITFGIANVFLCFFPLVRPPAGAEPYEALPYWTHAAGGSCQLFNNAAQAVVGSVAKPVVYVWETNDAAKPWSAQARLVAHEDGRLIKVLGNGSAAQKQEAKDIRRQEKDITRLSVLLTPALCKANSESTPHRRAHVTFHGFLLDVHDDFSPSVLFVPCGISSSPAWTV
ncbi:hypothetical protein NMY22_g5657 [Coprinellus aureogranulatus]|nr:hypothetical protein NMY22_g5657 [Coprinellus aureogranulatus]